MTKDTPVYLIPGRGELLTGELGVILNDLGFEVFGRNMIAGFERLRFSEQLELVKDDLQTGFWRSDAVLIGRSFGAYVLLHALAELTPFPGRVLLFSPVLGAAFDKSGFFGSIPPLAKKLREMTEAHRFPPPRYLEIHTGEDDNGCDPKLATRLAGLVLDSKAYVVPGAGHRLDPGYVERVLDGFLSSEDRSP